jgi:hypothetical protein
MKDGELHLPVLKRTAKIRKLLSCCIQGSVETAFSSPSLIDFAPLLETAILSCCTLFDQEDGFRATIHAQFLSTYDRQPPAGSSFVILLLHLSFLLNLSSSSSSLFFSSC